jgi:hypothetical protein
MMVYAEYERPGIVVLVAFTDRETREVQVKHSPCSNSFHVITSEKAREKYGKGGVALAQEYANASMRDAIIAGPKWGLAGGEILRTVSIYDAKLEER